MSGPASSAMDDHLERYDTSDSAVDSDSTDRDTPETSFWGTVFADSSHPVANSVFARWWSEQQPFVAQFVHDYASILAHFLTPFSPRAARRAGYCCSSQDLLRSLDRIDAELPGAGSGWSSRWRSRSKGFRGKSLHGRISSVYTAVGGAGVAAMVVIVAAAVSWCSWRRSSPSWPLLLGEVAIGSAGLAHYLAREDGYDEAKLLEAHLVALERSLGPFFRAVHACMRMVRCSQALSFGLRLSVPMPPVARMEGRLASAETSTNRQGRSELALRELRAILMDVLDGGVGQVNALQTLRERETGGSPESESKTSGPGNPRTPQVLVDLLGRESQLVADLHRFIAHLASKINGVTAEPEAWGLWWDSELQEASAGVGKLAKFFEAAGDRLEAAIGSGDLPSPASCEESHDGKVAEVAETLSSLRLHYEEIVVRLYSCQSNAIRIMRDPANDTADLWEVVRQGLVEARFLTGPLGSDDNELWRKAEHLLESNTKDGHGGANLDSGASASENHSDTSRHLEAGVGWVSLTTPREEGPRVFEGGSGDEEAMRTKPDTTGVTDVLVGVPSPGRTRTEAGPGGTFSKTPQALVNERSRAQLVGELDSVLRARPLPPTCEKHLPLESQHSLLGEDSGDMVEEQSVEQPMRVSTPPSMLPVAEGRDGQNLMSELREQLSMAANEEIFTAASSDNGEEEEENIALVEDD